MTNSHEFQHLFDQMDDAIADATTDDLDFTMEIMQEELDTIEREKIILSELKPHMDDVEILETILHKGNTPMTASNAMSNLDTLLDQLDLSPDEHRVAVSYISSLLHAISAIESCQSLPDIYSKRDVQARILTNNLLSHDDKNALIQTSNTLIHGPGVDLNNPDDVLNAINERKVEQDRSEGSTASNRKKRIIIDNELSKFNLRTDDPEYFLMTSMAMFQLTINMSPSHIVDSAKEHLEALGIDQEEYLESIKVIQQRLNSSIDD